MLGSVAGAIGEIPSEGQVNDLLSLLKKLGEGLKGFKAALTTLLTGIDNAVSDVITATGRSISDRALSIRQRITQMIDGVATKVLDDYQVMELHIEGLQQDMGDLVGERSTIQTTLTALREKLATVNDPAAKQQIQGEINKLEGEFDDVNSAIQDNIEGQANIHEQMSEYLRRKQEEAQQAVQKAFDDLLQAIDDELNRAISIIDLQERFFTYFNPGAELPDTFRLARASAARNAIWGLIHTGGLSLDEVAANFGIPPDQLANVLGPDPGPTPVGAARGARVPATPGGLPFVLGEGGFDEYVITTDPKQRASMLQYIKGLLVHFGQGRAFVADEGPPTATHTSYQTVTQTPAPPGAAPQPGVPPVPVVVVNPAPVQQPAQPAPAPAPTTAPPSTASVFAKIESLLTSLLGYLTNPSAGGAGGGGGGQDVNDMAPITWASTAWQWFRQAVFTGMGGLLPQYAMPSGAAGGAGGFPIPGTNGQPLPGTIGNNNGQGAHPWMTHHGAWSGDAHLHLTAPVEVADPATLARQFSWQLAGSGGVYFGTEGAPHTGSAGANRTNNPSPPWGGER
jgi:hypothetical protein